MSDVIDFFEAKERLQNKATKPKELDENMKLIFKMRHFLMMTAIGAHELIDEAPREE